jgi:signal peptidase I
MHLQHIRAESLKALAEQLKHGRPITVSVASSSMTPTIVPGDDLSVSSVPSDQLHIGDIVLFEREGDWIAHRLISLAHKDGLTRVVTRGDNAIGSDQPAPVSDVLGRVVEIRRDGRTVPLCRAMRSAIMDDLLLAASAPRKFDMGATLEIPGRFDGEEFVSRAEREGLAGLIYYHRCRSQNDRGTPARGCIQKPLHNGSRGRSPSILSGAACVLEGECPHEPFLTQPCAHAESVVQTPIPAETARLLEKKYHETLARNILLLHELSRLNETLAGVDLILLKGAYLALYVYPSPGLRPFSDIDILAKPADLQLLDQRLASQGYQCAGPANIGCSSAYLNSAEYRKPETGISIHLHWHLLNSITPKYTAATMDMAEIWASARRTNDTWLSLGVEHLVIHLAEHAMRHSFDRLVLLRDIAEVVLKYGMDIDWDRVVSASRDFGLAVPVYYTLHHVSRKMPINIPHTALSQLFPGRVGLPGKVFMKLTLAGKRPPELCNLVYLEQIASPGGKLAYIFSLLFPPRRTLAQAYCRSENEIGIPDYARRLIRGVRLVSRVAAG